MKIIDALTEKEKEDLRASRRARYKGIPLTEAQIDAERKYARVVGQTEKGKATSRRTSNRYREKKRAERMKFLLSQTE